jgi:tRNA U34 5-carboxymethylaminomethyl modifying enzyme MnmG/GidA
MAGINAARSTWNKDALVLKRNEAYIGVLIDDLGHERDQRALPHVHFTRRIPNPICDKTMPING